MACMRPAIITVVGAGLAGSEAAWQIARRGLAVRLVEMRPVRMTEAHQSANFAELVCSNSLRNAGLETAVGVLKEEMRRLGSIVVEAADRARVPAGAALAVDRDDFSKFITETLCAHPNIQVIRAEESELPAGIAIIATGPLTSPSLTAALSALIGSSNLYFYDAIAPIVSADSIDPSRVFRASRWGRGGDDYINCPMNESQYANFVQALVNAEKVPLHPFEKPIYFEGCMPIEEMARRGPMTLAFGPMRPVGLVDPRTGKRPFAVVQLRQDDHAGRIYNMVGFQTKMTYPEQRRVLRMIPGLERAEFARLGSLHRNTFVDSPRLLKPTLQLRAREDLFLAGQMIGVEGYVESAAAGLLAAINAVHLASGRAPAIAPRETALGSLVAHITDETRGAFQPMNASYGLMPDLKIRTSGKLRKIAMGERALARLDEWIAATKLGLDWNRDEQRAQARLLASASRNMKLGSFDIGTNTVLMLAVEIDADHKPRTICDCSRITRLGRGVDRNARLDPASATATLAAIEEFAARGREHGVERFVAAGTASLRDAADGAEFIRRVRERVGIELEIISGIEEARLSYLAVTRGLALDKTASLLIVDIGGGSTELIRASAGQQLETTSLQIGSVRMTERFIHSDPPSAEDTRRLISAIDDALAETGWNYQPRKLVGIAGTVTTICAVALGMRHYDAAAVHGSVLARTKVSETMELFRSRTLAERRAIPGLLEDRADVIFAGTMILDRVMERFAADEVIVSDQGVRWGLVWREIDRMRS